MVSACARKATFNLNLYRNDMQPEEANTRLPHLAQSVTGGERGFVVRRASVAVDVTPAINHQQ